MPHALNSTTEWGDTAPLALHGVPQVANAAPRARLPSCIHRDPPKMVTEARRRKSTYTQSITDADVLRLRAMAPDHTDAELAGLFSVTVSTVAQLRRHASRAHLGGTKTTRNNGAGSRPPAIRYTDAEALAIRTMRSDGVTWEAVGAALGRSPRGVQDWWRRYKARQVLTVEDDPGVVARRSPGRCPDNGRWS